MSLALLCSQRLKQLRYLLDQRQYAGFILPHQDEYQNEQLPFYNERLQWLTNFSGSAGIAVVLRNKAALFSDSRYNEQMRQQVNQNEYECLPLEDFFPWIIKNCSVEEVLTYDPWLHGVKEIGQWENRLSNYKLIPYEGLYTNPIDEVWIDRFSKRKDSLSEAQLISGAKTGTNSVNDYHYSGYSRLQKQQQLEKLLKQEKADAFLITHPPSVAWLLNIRSNEVPYSGFPLIRLCYVDQQFLIIGQQTDQLDFLQKDFTVHFFTPQEWALVTAHLKNKQVLTDFSTLPKGLKNLFDQMNILLKDYKDPCLLWKACKHPLEIEGFRTAHQRDGCAMIKFLYWFSQQPKGTLTEQDCIEQLEHFRQSQTNFQSLSFPSIAGAGPNGAIIHYRCNETTNRVLDSSDLFLIDSGSHYKEGTTDITRTLAVGTVTQEQKENYTRVLKGQIALSRVRFPEMVEGKGGVCGPHLDGLARSFLWEVGLDYGHGTGHGVGQYLNVHEGPQNIGRRAAMVVLQEGMILSNEPGYYKIGSYGIRLENLMVIQKVAEFPGFLQFETLTLVPFDQQLIDFSLLNETEKQWLKTYYKQIWKEISPLLLKEEQRWLKEIITSLEDFL